MKWFRELSNSMLWCTLLAELKRHIILSYCSTSFPILNKRNLLHIANESKNVYGQRCKVTNSFSLHFVKYSPHTQVVAINYICHGQLVCKMSWF